MNDQLPCRSKTALGVVAGGRPHHDRWPLRLPRIRADRTRGCNIKNHTSGRDSHAWRAVQARRAANPDAFASVSLHRTFHDDFDTHPLSDNRWAPHYAGGAAWPEARYWGGDGSDFRRKTSYNGEQQIYVDPRYGGRETTPLGLDPFRVTDGILSIVATRTPPELKAVLFNNEYTSRHPDDAEPVFPEVRLLRNPCQGAGRHRRVAGVLDAGR